MTDQAPDLIKIDTPPPDHTKINQGTDGSTEQMINFFPLPKLVGSQGTNLYSYPLDMYIQKYRPDVIFYEESPNTGCWRGYTAEWEIDDGMLYLLKINGYVAYKGRYPDVEIKDDIRWRNIHPELFKYKVPATLSELFGDVKDRVPATWYTGELRLASYWGSPNYDTIAVIGGICGERERVGNRNFDDELPF